VFLVFVFRVGVLILRLRFWVSIRVFESVTFELEFSFGFIVEFCFSFSSLCF
jgi:hypothetical protein